MEDNRKARRSIDRVAAGLYLTTLLPLLAVISLLLLSPLALSLYSSHVGLCQIISSQVERVREPLGREIFLGNSDLTAHIFDDFEKQLDLVSNRLQIQFVPGDGAAPSEFEAKGCHADLLGSHFVYNIRIDGQAVGRIEGDATSIHWTLLITLFGVVFALFIFASAIFIRQLVRLLRKNILDPIRMLSQGSDLNTSGQHLPEEVIEISENVRKLKETLVQTATQNERLTQSQRLSEQAAQVSHDIRSPLAALNMAIGALSGLPEEKRVIIRNAVQRINDISNELLMKSKATTARLPSEVLSPVADEPVMLVALLELIISEKRAEFRDRMNIEIQGDLDLGYGLFARVNASQFSRGVSNLINNAIESIESTGRVLVSIHVGTQQMIEVRVSDNGGGIPPEQLTKVGSKGFTFGKKNSPSGAGLGLFHARQTMESFGGRLEIESEFGHGTQIILKLPRAATPTWFVEVLEVPEKAIFVSVDDDRTIHQIWTDRINRDGFCAAGIQHMMFSSLNLFEGWVVQDKPDNAVFVVDYEFLGQDDDGLRMIERAGIASKSVLVTSRFDEPRVRERARLAGVRLLPKQLASLVPIRIAPREEKNTAVLIDDDSLIRDTWLLAAKMRGVHLTCFSSAGEFWKSESSLNRNVPLYIDVKLGENVSGEKIAGEALSLGFRNVYLMTGYSPESVSAPEGLAGVLGKDPPF